jgi:hypothetical protein
MASLLEPPENSRTTVGHVVLVATVLYSKVRGKLVGKAAADRIRDLAKRGELAV